jgi:hypothetical protein
VQAVSELLDEVATANSAELTDPRHYNIRWLELLNEVQPRMEHFGGVL